MVWQHKVWVVRNERVKYQVYGVGKVRSKVSGVEKILQVRGRRFRCGHLGEGEMQVKGR